MGGNTVLETTKRLIENPKYVFIDESRLEEVAEKFSRKELTIPVWDFPIYIEGNNENTIDFFLLGNSINFAFTDFKTDQKYTAEFMGKEEPGSSGMWACLKKAVEAGIPILEGNYLKNIPEEEMKKIFEGNIEMPMFQERLQIFREVGRVLCEKYGGHFYNLVEASNKRLFNKGKGLVERLTSDFPSFDDSVVYKGKRIRFDKRAQLAPGMLYGRFRNKGLFQIEDIEELTVFADYVVPTTEREKGVLIYEKSLAERVDNRQILDENSQEVLEIRASTIHSCEGIRIKLEVTYKIPNVTSLPIDYEWWSEGRKIKDGKPHPLIPSIRC